MSQIGDPTGSPFPPHNPPPVPATTTAPTVQKQISDALEPIVNAADTDTKVRMSVILHAFADGLCLPPCTDSQARFAVAASKKINALYNADDLEGLYKLIIAIRQAHGVDVDPAIVWA